MNSAPATMSSGAPRVPGVTVLHELGRGANAVTYRVRRDSLDWAMKVYAPQADGGRAAQLVLRREAALLTWVDHPGLPRVHEVGEVDAQAYMIMDLVEGRPLGDVLAAGPLGVEAALRVGRAVAEALAAVHRVGLVHRDVKPANIMIEPGGGARLIDFGMAARTDRDGGDAAAGTFLYAAPEQTGMIKRRVDGRADLYALGVVLFECLAGTPPFAADDAGELLRMHAVTPAPALAAYRPDAPAELCAIVARLLAKDPDDRYQRASLLLADLCVLDGAPVEDDDTEAVQVPFVGRDSQWQVLRAAWQGARSGAGGTVLVTGGMGTGKTRIADELIAQARADGAPVLYARCAAGAAPLAALREAVGTTVVDDMLTGPAALGQGIVAFLTDLARDAGGALLCLDDVDAADEASLAVLRQLVGQLDDCPLLILGTATGDRIAPPALQAVFGDPQPATALGPLDPGAVAALVTACARGLPADDELVQRLVTRGGATPFEVIEYVRAVVDAGLLAPAWGGWALDTEGLDDVALHADVHELMLSRLDGLEPATRRLLTVAAAIGATFAAELAAQADGSAGAAEAALGEALACRVLEQRGDRLAFVHDGIRTALLAGLDDEQRRALHQSIAEALEARPDDDPEHVHALARHYLLGDVEQAGERVAAACLAAGRLAFASFASAEAIECFETVQRLTDRVPWIVAHEVEELLGASYYQAGRLSDAERVLTRALGGVPARLDRARVLGALAEIQFAVGDLAGSMTTVRRALAELRRPLRTNPLVTVVSTLLSFVAGMFVERFRIGFGTADPRRRAAYLLRTRLYNVAAMSAILRMEPLNTVVLTLRSLYPAARLGVCVEYAHARSMTAALVRGIGLRSNRSAALARHAAALVGEPGIVEHVAWVERSMPHVLGKADIRRLVPDVLDRKQMFETGYYLKLLEGCLFLLLDAGYTDEAETLRADGGRRVAAADLTENTAAVWGVASAAARGKVAEADALWRQTIERQPAFTNPGDRQTRLHASIRSAVEQRDFPAAEHAAAEFAAMRLKPWTMPLYRRSIFSAIAYGRIEACLAAPPEGRPAALAAVDRAVRDLRGAKFGGRTLAAHHLIAHAYTRHLRGDHVGALAALASADRKLHAADAPLVTYEAARLRSRALAALGRREDATAHAATALAIAEQQRWPHRARWIRTEFDLGAALTGSQRVSASTNAFSSDRQRLAAVEQLSLVASRILDPTELTRVALDEIIKLLGADRAFLFLVGDADQLVPHQGRDAAGTDLTTPTEYGSTLVERVQHTRQALVVTGTDEGVALGSQSMLAHGLRSILIAPLLFDGRLLGVVYLDSRVAKGMFTAADAGVLTALTTHVAAALETARAAELAVAVNSARRERDIAETMRDAATYLSGTLDPADVLRRLHTTLRRALPAGPSRLAIIDNGKLHVYDEQDNPHDPIPVGPDTEPALTHLLTTTDPVTGHADTGPRPPATLGLTAAGPWLALPLRVRDQPLGLILLTCPDPAGYTSNQTEIGTALSTQGMTAYENARLFAQVEHLATTDGLTGLYNRRHFFEMAVRELALSGRRASPLTAVMLDIDHFKQVNDRHGHPVGDQVIVTVAQRLAATLRSTDVAGRYGGEEFAALLPDTDLDGSTTLTERLRVAVGDRPIETDAGLLTVTVSIGVANLYAGDSVADLLGRADKALYRAKEGGRNRVVISD